MDWAWQHPGIIQGANQSGSWLLRASSRTSTSARRSVGPVVSAPAGGSLQSSGLGVCVQVQRTEVSGLHVFIKKSNEVLRLRQGSQAAASFVKWSINAAVIAPSASIKNLEEDGGVWSELQSNRFASSIQFELTNQTGRLATSGNDSHLRYESHEDTRSLVGAGSPAPSYLNRVRDNAPSSASPPRLELRSSRVG